MKKTKLIMKKTKLIIKKNKIENEFKKKIDKK